MNLGNGLVVRHLGLLLVSLLALGGAPAQAQSLPATSAVAEHSAPETLAKQIEAGRKSLDTDVSLDEQERQQAAERYDQGQLWLRQAVEVRDGLALLQARVEQAPGRIKALKSGPGPGLERLDEILASGDLARVEQARLQEELALQQARERQQDQTDELARLLVGDKGLNEELAARLKALEQINGPATDPTTEGLALVQARTLARQARRMLLQYETDQIGLRLRGRDLLTNLAQAERDFSALELNQRQGRLAALTEAAQTLREGLARQAVREAEALRLRTGELPEALRDVAEENARHRQELEALIGSEQSTFAGLQVARAGLDEIRKDFERTRQRVEVAGATETIGRLLKRRRAELPPPSRHRRLSAQRAGEIRRATDRQIEVDELLRSADALRQRVAQAIAAAPEGERALLRREAASLEEGHRDGLNELQKVYGRYVGLASALDLAERQLAEVAGEYIDYIDDQLIWVPGPGVEALLHPTALLGAVAWLLEPGHWLATLGDLGDLGHERGIWLAGLLLFFVIALGKRQAVERRLVSLSSRTYKIRTDSMAITLYALGYTLLAISAWPVLLGGLGWLLAGLPTASPFSLFVANGLVKAGLLLFSLGFVIQVSLPNGLGDRHLRWSPGARQAVAREFSWILPFALPLGFLIGAMASGEAPPEAQILGRLAFVLLMALSVALVFRLTRRGGAFMAALGQKGRNKTVLQLHFLWFPLLLLMPAAYAFTSAVGYHNIALYLEQRGEQTFWFFVVLFLVKELLLRSLYVAGRRFHLEEALRRRAEARAQRSEPVDEEMAAISLELPEVDFEQLSEQNKRLLRAGFLFSAVIGIWSIWSDLLPALAFLNETELPFHAARVVDGISREVPVTLGDLTLGLIIIGVTVLAAKNIPGVLEIALLQRLPLDSGARYAITSLSQYAIAGFGVVFAFSTLGLQWSSIQWLVAALGVGLGFGLQEIVANFISGIILLFERPIRVGDVVTIDNTTGKVSRIRIRATTIVNWDMQELLIPNKEFITGRVINWTLSDRVNRVVVSVGVAYGSDVARAMALLLEAARENPNVLHEPESIASFEGFGDNALNLLLRAYLGSLDNRLATITALHQAINDKFRAAGIDIAFPQRDLHLETRAPLDIRLHRSAPEAGP
ncbi:MAG: mechanosensitive ion channel [gamma proteobacterium symbiont of Phacoides pectinatus]